MISDADIERALDFLRETAHEIGAKRGEAIKTERMVGHVEAIEMKKRNEEAVAAQKREARASQAYVDALNAEAQAVADYETLKARRAAAEITISAWQTMSRGERGARP